MKKKLKLSEKIRDECLRIIRGSKGIDFSWIARNTYYSEWYYEARALELKIARLEKKLENIQKIIE